MVETGVVSKVKENGWATVRFDRKTACENCRMCLKPRDENYVELKLKNTLDAKLGDKVSVSIGDRAVIKASLTVYVIPLIFLGVALGISSAFLKDVYAVLIGVAALIPGFAVVKLIETKLKGKKDYLPVMTEIITEKPSMEDVL